MKFLHILLFINRVTDHFTMLRLFISKCLLFKSTERMYWVLGLLGWGSLMLLVYGIVNLF